MTRGLGSLSTLILIGLLFALWAARRTLVRRRTERLMAELETGLTLATEAQHFHWRTERRYTDDLAELIRLRPALAPFLDASLHGKQTEWELSAEADGSTFDLSVMAVPVARIKGERVFKHLVLVSGERGAVSRDELAAQ
jgi:hypothetical protein